MASGRFIAIAVSSLITAAASHGGEQLPSYALTQVVMPEASATMTLHDINDGGVIVGVANGVTAQGGAVAWLDGPENVPTVLSPKQPLSVAMGINEHGMIAGFAGEVQPIRWTIKGKSSIEATVLPTLGGTGIARDINNSGVLTGSINRGVAVIWVDGEVMELGSLVKGGSSDGAEINDAGVVVGTAVDADGVRRAVVFDERGPMALPDLNGDFNEAAAISNTNVIVGCVSVGSNSTDTRPVMWIDGALTELPLLANTGRGEALGVNDAGDIVGSAFSVGLTNVRATLWRDGRALDLNDLAADVPDEWILRRATAINNDGQIIGVARVRSDLSFRWFLLTPIMSADLDGDGAVSAADLAILLGAWSVPAATPGCGGMLPCPADLNTDGLVNAADLAILLGAWTP